MRFIILHNHLFKNAGTSIDHILKQNFQDRWVTAEFQSTKAENTSDVTDWINSNPTAVAFSSHTILGPLPQIPEVRIIPITMLRDPVDRIASAYRFERVQDADTRGTQLARTNGFAGYVHARLATPGDRQCRNFQTARLAALAPNAPGSELDRACFAATKLTRDGVLGNVANFDGAMHRLCDILKPAFPDFVWRAVTANVTAPISANTVSPDMRGMLEETNGDDFALLHHARSSTRQTSTGALADQVAGMA